MTKYYKLQNYRYEESAGTSYPIYTAKINYTYVKL